MRHFSGRSSLEAALAKAGDAVRCEHCGATLDFTAPDPLFIGRTMQRCTGPVSCPGHALTPVPLRRI